MSYYTITFAYLDKQYSYEDGYDYLGWDANRNADYQVVYMYTQGNYGCDCNRSIFIASGCDEGFPELSCGHEITLISIKEGERIVWPEPSEAPPVTYKQRASGLFVPVGGGSDA